MGRKPGKAVFIKTKQIYISIRQYHDVK